MVGIRVARTYVGLVLGSIVAVKVWLGLGVNVAITVVVEDGIGDGIAIADWPQATNSDPIPRKIIARKSFFMSTCYP